MFNLWFTLNDLKQLFYALIGMICVIYLANESGIMNYFMTIVHWPIRLDAKITTTIIFGTIWVFVKKLVLRNEPVYNQNK